jgi:hypothetical protein
MPFASVGVAADSADNRMNIVARAVVTVAGMFPTWKVYCI